MSNPFEGRSVLVTGAGGSIGSQLCRQIVASDAKRLTMISLTEAGLYNIDRELRVMGGRTELVPILGDAGDTLLLREALKGVDIVIHAAAHKHVPICEANPAQAILNNVLGTWTLIEASIRAEVSQFCLISSDKAVRPASVMGATKRLAELLVREAMHRPRSTRLCVVRFGNVCDSAGSVLPLWREQIARGGPLTITDERCERYFMSIDNAVGLVEGVLALHSEGTFVFDMGPPKKLIDIAREMIRESGKDIEIRTIGLRPGEKITEELHHGGELLKTELQRVYKVKEPKRERLDPQKLDALFAAALRRDPWSSVDLLWALVKEPTAA